jgi:sugar/nucleoside kinase (ribokinase family)
LIPDFVAVGHVTLDRTAGAVRPGGSAYYAALTAHRLGCRVGVLTSFGPDFPRDALPADIEVVGVPSDRTTIYELQATPKGRQLILHSRASDLEVGSLPGEWHQAPLSLLCPIVSEVDPAIAAVFREGSVGVAPQGWLRRRGRGGAITSQTWEDADVVLPQAQVVVVSDEDIAPFEKAALEWFEQVPLGAVTQGRRGAILYVNGERFHVDPDPARETDSTGAGDVFAATLLIEYHREGNPWEAAEAAACAAAASVEAEGAAGIPARSALDARVASYRRRHGG